MQEPYTEETVRALAKALCGPLCDELSVRLFHLLADGRPVSLDRLGAAARRPLAEVTAAVRRLPNVEFDSEGRVIGQGITLVSTPHRFFVGGRALFTWCAWDTLIFPPLLGRTARAESPCPATGSVVRVSVGTAGVEQVEPEGAVVSMVVPECESAGCDVRGSFCDHVHFFRSREAAATWREEHPGGLILSVADAYELGRGVQAIHAREGVGLEASRGALPSERSAEVAER